MSDSIHGQMTAHTRQLIKNTFIALIEAEGFYKVSVRDLASKAFINRGTFYLHFTDKYDLMEQLQDEILSGLQKTMVVPIIQSEMAQHYLDGIPYPPFVDIFTYLRQNGNLIRLLLSSKGETSFPGKLKGLVKASFYKKLANNGVFAGNPSIPPEYLAAQTASVFLGVTEEWLNTGMPYSPEELSVIYSKMLFMQPDIIPT